MLFSGDACHVLCCVILIDCVTVNKQNSVFVTAELKLNNDFQQYVMLHAKKGLWAYVGRVAPDQPAHPGSLICEPSCTLIRK